MTHLVVRGGGGGGGVRVIPRKGGQFHSLSPYHKDVMCMARASVVINVMLRRKNRIRGHRSGILSRDLISR